MNRLRDIGPCLFNSPAELAARQRVFDRAQQRLELQRLENKKLERLSIAPTARRPKVDRNGPCWCGSGAKFKKCHYPNQ